MKRINLILPFLLISNWLLSQSLTFDHYGLEDGLSQQTIRCIIKGRDGFLWLGTQDGLNRFDGKNFKVYQHHPKDSLSISGNYINRLLENTDGTIWIATGGDGVCYYAPETDTFSKVPLENGNYITLAIDKNGNVYTSTDQAGLIVLIKTENYARTYFNIDKKIVTALAVEDNSLLVGTKSGKLMIGDIGNLNKWTTAQVTLPGSIEEIVRYKNDWLLGTSRGLYLYQEEQDQITALDVIEDDGPSNDVLFIESISVVNNTFYVGADNGFFILNDLDISTGRFSSVKVYKGDLEDSNTITSNRVYDVLVDNELTFIGTNNLDIASKGLDVFKKVNPQTKPWLNNNYVFSIYKEGNYLFVGTRKGINCIDSNGDTYVISKESTNQELAYDVIRGMAKDNENNLWVATTKGVSVISLDNFNPKQPKIKSFYFDENDPKSLSNDKTRSVYKDHNGSMWVCTYGGGLNRFTGNLTRNEISFERYGMGNGQSSLSSDFVYNIVQDGANSYWISSEYGLNRLEFKGDNYQNPSFITYTSDGSDGSLKNNSILNVFLDSEKTLWVASQSGIHKYNAQEDTFTHYGEEYGLSNNYVYGILEEADGMLWASTNNGLFRFDKRNEIFTHFTIKDGLQSSEFNLGAHFNDFENNVLYFGGINGYNSFEPEKVNQLDWQGNLSLTSIKIQDREINPITHPKVLDIAFTRAKEITLRYDSFPSYIQFTDFDYRPNKNTQYHYSLGNADWYGLGYANELQILQLPKGEHTLKIQGSSRDGFWQKDPLQLKINVFPPWYDSNLAYLLYALFLLGTGYLIYLFRLRQKMTLQEAKRLKELDAVKSKFITNITHEFRTPLTVILGYINTLNTEFGENSKVQLALSSIENNSKNLLKLVNEMLDLAKLETNNLKLNISNIDLAVYTHYIVQSFSSLANLKKIQLKCIKAENAILTDVDPEKMRQILYNLISNAIKFSDEGSAVKVLVAKEDNWATITIQDQGVGIPKEELPFIFDRFFRSSKTSLKNSGSGIGLSLTKELIALMNGELTVDSIENIGTTFKLKLPLSNPSLPSHDNLPLQKALETLPEQPQIEFNPSPQAGANTILVVEDNTDIATYIGSRLDAHYNLLFAYNGKEGFEIADREIPDIILTDVMMPLMNGYELTNKLQENIATNHIPIIMLTAKSLDEDRLEGLKSGADAYLTKPFSEEELLIRISKLIEKRNLLQSKYQISITQSPSKTALKSDKNLRFLNKAIGLVHNNLDNSKYDSGLLAKDLAMSESQLYRKLRAITDKSTAIFIRHVRLEKAKELLKNSEKTVAEVAFETGFNDPNWFSKVFREAFGVSPTKFRN
ncbi:ATP-binding protein [Flavobacteriaceae bacterium D16]|nr:ATP-binding protein [Flavobacteriaceae bacterium D16]